MGILLKLSISRNPDGVHMNQTRFNAKWKHISNRGFNSLGTSNNFGSVINLTVEPFHLSSSMNRSSLTKMSIFMKIPNDRSFVGVKESSSCQNIQTSQLMVIYNNNVFFCLFSVGSSHQHQLDLHWLPYQPSDWWNGWL